MMSHATIETQESSESASGWLLIAAGTVLATAAYAPLLVEHARNLWSRPHYQFYPFALAAFGGITYFRLRSAEPLSRGEGTPRFFAPALGVAAIALLAVAVFAYSPWAAAISAVVLVAAVFARIQQDYRASGLWGAWVILWLLIPLPLNRDQLLIASLQRFSSRVSSWLLDWFGVLHVMDGNTLTLRDKQLFVDEACSGIISVMSLVACAVIYGVWLRRSVLHVAALALAGVAWAVFTNIVRIVTIAVAYEWYGVDLTTGAVHEGLSLVVFTLAFLGLASTDRLLAPLLAPVSEAWELMAKAPLRYGGWLVRAWDACFSQSAVASDDFEEEYETSSRVPEVVLGALSPKGPVVAIVASLAVLAAAQGYFWGTAEDAQVAVAGEVDRLPRALALDRDSLPATLAGFNVTDFEFERRDSNHVFGAYSAVYRCVDKSGRTAIVSCSFPFHDAWHDLTVCYQGVGWETESQRPLSVANADRPDAKWTMEAEFRQSAESNAYLVYRYFDAYGNWIEPPQQDVLGEAMRSLGKRELLDRFRQRFQVQVLMVGAEPFDEPTRLAAQSLLAAASDLFRTTICADEPGADAAPTTANNTSASDATVDEATASSSPAE
ncbi:MAG: exosortase U [Planctomycetales bacterium]|nr:exosortase U [Planctomycetales bacterium]